jgi:hypothetical protein
VQGVSCFVVYCVGERLIYGKKKDHGHGHDHGHEAHKGAAHH